MSSDTEDSDIDTEETRGSEYYDFEGSVLNKYNIIQEIGRGSYSTVWLGYNIENSKYYAIKIYNPIDYKSGYNENKLMKRIPEHTTINNLIEDFVYKRDDNKFLCSVYNLHSGNLDGLIRKGEYSSGFPFNVVIKMMKQIIHGLSFIHNKLNVCHGDLKTDNILLKGNNEYINYIINKYNNLNFNEQYKESKKQYTNKISPDKKHTLKTKIHSNLCSILFSDIDNINLTKYDINTYLIENSNICIADFGNFIEEGEYYDNAYGTLYYRSPENILVINHNNNTTYYSNDIWALGCIFYELLTGKILFEPDKDSTYSREMYHLKLINELCNNFSEEFLRKTKKYKNYFDSYGKLKCNKDLGFKTKVESELRRVVPENHYDNIVAILLGLLTIDPKKRVSINECVKLFNYF